MSLAENYNVYDANMPVFKNTPLHARRNKSGPGIHFTTIRDAGECGPTLCCWIEYTSHHKPSQQHLEIELGRVLEVDEVFVTPVRYGERSVIRKHDDITLPTGPHWVDTANVILNECVGIQERIQDEIRDSLT
jgi:hypothetical protein